MSTVSIIANGESHIVPDEFPIASFLEKTGLDLNQVIVEYNGEAKTRTQVAEIKLSEGDRLEIVRIVAGG